MCGIAGAFHTRGPVDAGAVAGMLAAMGHRGPDGRGLVVSGPCALGHGRLALHDLTPAGLQPMSSPEGDLLVAVNGTIHNAPALRGLERDHPFASRSDSEVLLPLYRRHGAAFVEKLRGPFALALVDLPRGRLVLARDRLGQRPLFVSSHGGSVTFASEQGALLRLLSGCTFSPERAAALLRAGYVPADATLVDEVRSLPPAHRLVVDGSGTRLERYWSPPRAPEPVRGGSEPARVLGERLSEAVSLRTRTERRLGVLLSGGLDSAGLLHALRAAGRPPPACFTLGFDDPRLDERGPAAAAARAFGCEHRAYAFDRDPGPYLARLIARTGEPLADCSWLPTARLFELAAADATVFLSGEGGDEVLLGYRRHALGALAGRLPSRLLRMLARLHGPVPDGTAARALAALDGGDLPAILADLAAVCPRRDLVRFLARAARERPDPLAASLRAVEPPRDGGAGVLGFLDLVTYLPGDLLAKADRAAMHAGVEAWCPFLDHPLVESMLRLPAAARLRGLRGKRPLRALLAGSLPEEHLRRRKRGFAAPLAAWLRDGSYGRFAEEVLGDVTAPFEGVLEGGRAGRVLRCFQEGEAGLAPLVHACVVLALWWQEFLA